MRSTNAIDKIIKELAYKDYLAFNPRKADGTPKYKRHRPYTLSAETNEAREIKSDYIKGIITEEEYKAYCLRYNLRSRDDRKRRDSKIR